MNADINKELKECRLALIDVRSTVDCDETIDLFETERLFEAIDDAVDKLDDVIDWEDEEEAKQ